jgi:lipoate-protein ligase A
LSWVELLGRLRGASWQYLLDDPRFGEENMQRDLALLEESTGPVLRLYSWRLPCLSLGYGQKDAWVDRGLCARLGVEVVRRPTGGRALLHQPDEITYAVVLPDAAGVSVQEAFEGIAALLAQALARLGLPVQTARTHHAPSSGAHPSCLAVAAPGEVVAGGLKLVGSAQVRRQGRLLQHGALPRRTDAELLARVIPGALPQSDLASIGFENLQAADLARAFAEVLRQQIES